MTAIHQFEPALCVHTPHGEGKALLLLDYGADHNTLWLVRLSGGEPKHYWSPDIRLYGNPADGDGWDINIPEDWVQ